MNNSQHPIMTVTGIRKSAGDFKDDNGKTIEYSNTVVTVLQNYSERELEEGAIGFKSTEYKIKGSQFFNDYMHQKVPAEAAMIFDWDFTGKQPKAVLVALDFNVKKQEIKSL
ncbi:hypothetical protein F7R97_09560 [Acinetobacter baumannii]|uniref:hypothetical protein n=1 Tax=Acinetobacter baumannii TaxID=470 RepID=UPI00029DDEF8|nr:hypothetical protein [Acinetobacter baumannii]EHU2434390.1 hypothetical protein [Acinetobacter baumannii]EIB6860229.1 hypothetical protein [Acinetobacter baumannii]EIB6924479.1 hypothetical protein [Acinetobacter baumannii]EKU56258.1 hypothetical protein ACINWC348_2048 [Acinetobacter baumannii WC-348]EXF14357.1 hypothetical protein J601_3815 [Acinetobacter baumannii 831240]